MLAEKDADSYMVARCDYARCRTWGWLIVSVNRGRFVLLAVGAIALLGLVGAYQLDPKGFVSAPLDYLYRVVQLFAAEGDWTAGHSRLPLALEIARFAAPIVTIASLIVLFAEGIWTALISHGTGAQRTSAQTRRCCH